ncbi:MAG: hypothetical protein ACXAB9_13180 [Candidatus Thorarchaeota archaeon]|jgi:hypothetical protein
MLKIKQMFCKERNIAKEDIDLRIDRTELNEIKKETLNYFETKSEKDNQYATRAK